MFYLRTLNNGFTKIPARALKVTLDNSINSFLELVPNSKDIANHHRSIQILMKELYDITKNLLPTILADILTKDY